MEQLSFGFYGETEKLFSQEELDAVLEEESAFYRDYAEKYWLERYYMIKRMSQSTHVPSITSVITETPSVITNEFRSKTESSAMKSLSASDWLDHFHEKLNLLPVELKRLIEVKYLSGRQTDGTFIADEYVYPRLNIGRNKYFKMKKQALDELGRYLYGTWQ